jgi:predicted metal-dependent peptidase
VTLPSDSAASAARPRLDRAKVLAARFRAGNERPYLASALYALSLVPTTELLTMAVDAYWRCYVNPDFVVATPVPELAGVWVHEVSHLLRDHPGRAARLAPEFAGDRRRVNLAQDCEINDDLVGDGLRLPTDHIRPATFGLPEGKLFEEYLPGIPPSQPCTPCGSGAYGGVEPWDLGPAGIRVSPTEAEAIRRYTADAIRAHLRTRGKVPVGWRRWADQVLEPTVDWREVLAGSTRQAIGWVSGAVDYTYLRPSRRAAAQPRVVLPSMRRPLPTVAIVVDTSGSMSDDDLAEAMAEVAGVLRGVGIRGNRITVFACDAAVGVAQRVARAEELDLTGGGGTDMRVGIAAALAQPRPPDVIVVLTDGATPWPAEPPPARVIAGLIGTDPPLPPAWMESVRIAPAR